MKLKTIFIVTLHFCLTTFDLARAFNSEIDGDKVRTFKNRVPRRGRGRSVTFEIDEKDYHFNFEPSNRRVYSSDIPVWLAKSRPGSSPNYTYEPVPYTERMLSNGQFYVDNAKKAVVFVHYDEKINELVYDGLFGESKNLLLIESFPESQKYKLEKLREERKKLERYWAEHGGDPRRNQYTLATAGEEKRSKRSTDPRYEKLAKPLDVLYPKLLVLVDNALFKYHKNDIAAIVKYIATFWNAVDQKYVDLDSDVQLSITGIIIADDETAFNYVNMGQLEEEKFGPGRAHIPYIYEYMRKYFHYNFSKDMDFQNYDAAVLMTALDSRPYVGITQSGKICGDWYNQILINDEGFYQSIHTAIHELAHALGAQHDNYNGTSECKYRDNNNGISVMSSVQVEGDYFFWSECTKRDIREFRTTKAAECLATRHRQRHYDERNDW